MGPFARHVAAELLVDEHGDNYHGVLEAGKFVRETQPPLVVPVARHGEVLDLQPQGLANARREGVLPGEPVAEADRLASDQERWSGRIDHGGFVRSAISAGIDGVLDLAPRLRHMHRLRRHEPPSVSAVVHDERSGPTDRWRFAELVQSQYGLSQEKRCEDRHPYPRHRRKSDSGRHPRGPACQARNAGEENGARGEQRASKDGRQHVIERPGEATAH
jgi:hypothetical protein